VPAEFAILASMAVVRVLSWNVNGRVRAALLRQLDAVLAQEPDVVALQEVTAGSYAGWSCELLNAGFSVVSTIDLLSRPYPPPPYPMPPFPRAVIRDGHIARKYLNVVASRHPIAMLTGLSFVDPDEARFAFPEKYIAARTRVAGVEIDLHNAHLPPGVSRGVVKVYAFEAIRRRIDADQRNPRILCGDFNAPWTEDADGPINGLTKWPGVGSKRSPTSFVILTFGTYTATSIPQARPSPLRTLRRGPLVGTTTSSRRRSRPRPPANT